MNKIVTKDKTIFSYVWSPAGIFVGSIATWLLCDPGVYIKYPTQSARDVAALFAVCLSVVWITGVIKLFDRSTALGKTLLIVALIVVTLMLFGAYMSVSFMRGSS